MYNLFQYNWQVRDDWFKWCEQLSKEELLRKRIGGVGSILETLFHIVDVEYSWINALQEKKMVHRSLKSINLSKSESVI